MKFKLLWTVNHNVERAKYLKIKSHKLISCKIKIILLNRKFEKKLYSKTF